MTTHSMTDFAFVFPGQGSQSVGMLKAIAEPFPQIQATFAQASQALQLDLWELAQFGPENRLNETVNTQPALLTAGVALWRLWLSQGGPLPRLLAGHSLGEYTALVCAQALSLEEGVKLVAKRGQLMQEAVPTGVGAMAAVLGLDNAILAEVCQTAAQGEVVSAVNFNAIGQTVIAGHAAAVERACTLAKEKGAKKVIPLPVSVPSHCRLMQPAADLLAEHLSQIPLKRPTIPIVHNVDVTRSDHPDDIRQRLVQQLYSPVRWVETIQYFRQDGIQTAMECGPGKVLAGLIKRIEPDLKTYSIEVPADFNAALATISHG